MENLKSCDLLNQVEEILIIDLLEPSFSLSQKLLDALEPNKSGLYVKGSSEPMFRGNETYLVMDKNDTALFTCDIDDIIAFISDVNSNKNFNAGSYINNSVGKQVVKLSTLVSYRNKLTTNPNYPVEALNMVQAVLLNYLYTVCRHNKQPINLYKQVKAEFSNFIDEELYQLELDQYIDKIMNFIGKDYYHIYFHKRSGSCLIIEKAVDYRIYSYYKMIEERDSKNATD